MRGIAIALGLVALGGTAAPAATPPRFYCTLKRVVNFGKVAVGKSKRITYRVGNRGSEQLIATWENHPSPEFEGNTEGGAFAAGRIFKFHLSFQPHDKGPYEVPLVFTTNDPQRPEVTILLRGQGYFRRFK